MANMAKFRFVSSLLVSALLLTQLSACENATNTTSYNEGASATTVASGKNDHSNDNSEWQKIQQQRSQQLSDYLAKKEVAYRWFADFPMGIDDGVPYLILKAMPKLAPEFWGSEENFLDVVGMFKDERLANYPIARGFGWSGLAREGEQLTAEVDYSSFTCGACHVGRVKTDDGFTYLDGGVNAEFNLPQYRVRAMNTLNKITAGAKNDDEKIALATQAIMTAIDALHAQDKNYFYQNYQFGNNTFDANYEAKQIALFKQKAQVTIAGFIIRTTLEFEAFGALIDKNYHNHQQAMLDGFGGMADATGVSTSFGYAYQKAQGNPVDPATDLPPTQGITDFMVVWEQGKRKVRWSEDKTQLIEGGGQWNGNIPVPMFRNMAAELTMGFGEKTDLRIAAFAKGLLEDLPAPVYPFNVDMAKAKQGKTLFNENCADCHAPHNGEVYTNMGTDLQRTLIAPDLITQGARRLFTSICSPTTELYLPTEGKVTPCAEFEGVSLKDRSEVAMMDPEKHLGYNALPLGGIWAQAPYLHNGSVPTMYHLLMPKERPTQFIKSRLDYDQTLLGFRWEITPEQNDSQNSYLFDTQSIKAFSNAGHDKNMSINGKKYLLDWSDDKAGAMAIIEYMKTL